MNCGTLPRKAGLWSVIMTANPASYFFRTHPVSCVAAARMMTRAGATWLTSRTDELKEKNDYAHGQALEFYNSGHYDYGELEWHSPVENLQPGQSHSIELRYQVIAEKPHHSTSDVYQMIESELARIIHEITQSFRKAGPAHPLCP